MTENRRQLTLIMLKPDGDNRTIVLTRKRLVWFFSILSLMVILAGVLIYLVIDQHIRLRNLWEEHQLLISREIVALTPPPVGAERIPASSTGQDEVDRRQPAIPEPGEPIVARQYPDPEEALVRIDDFRMIAMEGGSQWQLQAQLTKSEWTSEVQSGYIIVLIEDTVRPGRYFTHPLVTVANGRPLSPQAGDSFSIRRLKPLLYDISLPEGFLMREVRLLVYNRAGELILDQGFPVEGG